MSFDGDYFTKVRLKKHDSYRPKRVARELIPLSVDVPPRPKRNRVAALLRALVRDGTVLAKEEEGRDEVGWGGVGWGEGGSE